MSAVPEAYQALGLQHGALAEEVKRAWKRLMLQCHPDKHGNSAESDERTKRLNSAKDLLLEPNPAHEALAESLRKAREAAAETARKAQATMERLRKE